jgi:acetyl esterase/lipase
MPACSKFDDFRRPGKQSCSVCHERCKKNTPVSPLDGIGALRAPKVALDGTSDRFVPASELQTLDQALQTAGKPYELFRYCSAPDAFDEDFGPAHRPVAEREAGQRTLPFSIDT